MSKILLIIYFIGGNSTSTYNQQFNFQQFQTVAQCEAAVVLMKEMTTRWHLGDNKENKVPALYSSECWEVPGYKEDYKNDPTRYLKVQVQTPKPEAQMPEHLNRRWNDL